MAAVLSYVYGGQGKRTGAILPVSHPLTRERFVSQVCQALWSAGIHVSKYAGHSFQVGAAMTTSSCSLQHSLIKTMGRWESSVYTLYIRIYTTGNPLSILSSLNEPDVGEGSTRPLDPTEHYLIRYLHCILLLCSLSFELGC